MTPIDLDATCAVCENPLHKHDYYHQYALAVNGVPPPPRISFSQGLRCPGSDTWRDGWTTWPEALGHDSLINLKLTK